MTRFLAETRERFLLAIAARVAPERFIELHFFQPIRQGGIESGVAVIAAHPERPDAAPMLADAPPRDEQEELGLPDDGVSSDDEEDTPKRLAAGRYTVYTAKYRLVLKGLDRGKWDCSVVAEADAPLVTVETVVRGVQRRSGDAEGPTRMSGDEIRAYLTANARRD